MTNEASARPAPTSLDLLGLAAGLAGASASITVMFLAMRAVMGVGGACAEGGAYQIAVHCPDGAGAGMTFGIFALLAFWALTARYGPRVGGFWDSAPVLPWTGLFVGLGWNFLEAGFAGEMTGWLLGGMFWVMGLAPLAAVFLGFWTGDGISAARRAAASRQGYTGYGGPVARPAHLAPTRAATDGHAVRAQLLDAIARDLAAVETRSAPGVTIVPGAGAEPNGDTEALVSHLEKLADLHAKGLLDADEYAAAKSAIVKALEGIR